MRPKNIPALTSIRFFAAAWVVCFHLSHLSHPFWLKSLFGRGYVGVSLFFLLSGFILAYTYKLGDDVVDKRTFWIARFARIYPVYAVALLLWLPVSLWSYVKHPSLTAVASFITSPLLLQAWYPGLSTVNPASWSLSVEALFYILFPLIGARFARKSLKNPLLWATGIWILALIPPISYLILHPDGAATVDASSRGFWLEVLKFNPLCRLPEFLMGIALAMEFRKRKSFNAAGLSATFAVSAIFLIAASKAPIPYTLLHNAMLTPVFGLLLLSLAYENSFWNALLSSRPLVLLGEASFSLYILHCVVVAWTDILVRRFAPSLFNTPALTSFKFIGSVCLSILAYKFFELPARRFLVRVLAQKARTIQAPLVASASSCD